jgi:hypothetical protein
MVMGRIEQSSAVRYTDYENPRLLSQHSKCWAIVIRPLSRTDCGCDFEFSNRLLPRLDTDHNLRRGGGVDHDGTHVLN